jgi:hypothetical protein
MTLTPMNTHPLNVYKPGLTWADVLDTLEDLATQKQTRPEGALTASEWAQAWGVGLDKARQTIKRLVNGHKMICHRVQITDVTGRINRTYVYQPCNV